MELLVFIGLVGGLKYKAEKLGQAEKS